MKELFEVCDSEPSQPSLSVCVIRQLHVTPQWYVALQLHVISRSHVSAADSCV